MLFIQGTRDSLATLDLIERVVGGLGKRAKLLIIEGGDHSFHVPRRTGKTDAQVLGEIADAVASWGLSLAGG
jgi:predicted alpha/beta-hydrolase family hydrolase